MDHAAAAEASSDLNSLEHFLDHTEPGGVVPTVGYAMLLFDCLERRLRNHVEFRPLLEALREILRGRFLPDAAEAVREWRVKETNAVLELRKAIAAAKCKGGAGD